MKKIQKIGKTLVDTVEVYIPFTAFSVLFLVFILGIVFRYFFKPLTWTLELSLMCFIWTSLLGGIYAKRDDSHVMFTMLYDSVGPLAQLWMRISGNILLIISFLIGLIPSWKYVNFMNYKKSNVLKIPMDIVFFPFVIFLAFMIGRFSIDLVRDLKRLKSGEYHS